jgi:hypothetical protein
MSVSKLLVFVIVQQNVRSRNKGRMQLRHSAPRTNEDGPREGESPHPVSQR